MRWWGSHERWTFGDVYVGWWGSHEQWTFGDVYVGWRAGGAARRPRRGRVGVQVTRRDGSSTFPRECALVNVR